LAADRLHLRVGLRHDLRLVDLHLGQLRGVDDHLRVDDRIEDLAKHLGLRRRVGRHAHVPARELQLCLAHDLAEENGLRVHHGNHAITEGRAATRPAHGG
jgi:hypothetical protein